MKLTESTNICCTSDRVVCTVKVEYQRNIYGKGWFCTNVYLVNGLQSDNKRPINWLNTSERRADSFYSVPSLGNPWTYVNQGWCYKVLQYIMTWKMKKQPDESLIGNCEHNIIKRFLSHGGMWTQHNPRAPLGVIYYDIKRILLANLQYYQKICIQVFPLSWSINSASSFQLLLATFL